MKFILYILLFALISCSYTGKRTEKQKIQTEVNQALYDKSEDISKCLKEHQIFKKFKTERLRIDVNMRINDEGKMEKFALENDKNYPTEFVDCLFNTLDQTKFPKLKKGEALELSQPFIFKS